MRWWHAVLAAVAVAGGIVAFLLGCRSSRPNFETEIEAVELKAEIKKRVAESDAASARDYIEARYAETIRRLDDEARVHAARLRDDPLALAEFLFRATRTGRVE